MNLSLQEIAQIIGQLMMENAALRKRLTELEGERAEQDPREDPIGAAS